MKARGKVWIIYDAENKSQSKPLSVVQTQVVLLSIQPHSFGRYFLWTPGWEKWMSLREFIEEDQKYFVLAHPPKPADEVPETSTPGLRNQAPNIASSSSTSMTEDTVTALISSFTQENAFTEVETADPELTKQSSDYGYYHRDFHGSDLDLSKIRKIKPDTTKKKSPIQQKNKDASPPEAERRRHERHNFKIEVVLVSKTRSFRTYSKNISITGTMLENEIPKEFLKKPFDLIVVNPFEPDVRKSRLLFKAKIVGDLEDPRRLMFLERDNEMAARLEALLKAYVAYQTQMKKSAG